MDKVAQDRRGRYVEQRRRYSHNEQAQLLMLGMSGLVLWSTASRANLKSTVVIVFVVPFITTTELLGPFQTRGLPQAQSLIIGTLLMITMLAPRGFPQV